MATIEQQRALAMAKARLRLQEQAVQPQPKEDPYSAENIAGAAVEPLMTMGSGALATPIAGLAGLGTMAANIFREKDEDPVETIRSVQEAMTYEPRTSGGQIALETISYPFRKYAEGTEALGQQVAEREQRMGDSPEIAAAKGALTKTALDVIPMVFGAKAMKGKPTFPKVEKVIKETVKAPVKVVGQALHAGKEAVSHRLPGGHERAIGDAVVEMLGPKTGQVVKALEKAKPGETAGQAAARTGAYEFSALQKMAQDIDPSGYGDIMRAQQFGRLKELKKIGKTPKKLKTAEALMKRHAEEGYGAVRDVKTDVSISTLPEKFTGRPSVARAIESARDAAKETKSYFPTSKNEPLTVGNLQRIKRAMADEVSPKPGAPSPLAKTQAKEVGDTVRDYTDWLRKKSPEFAKAEDMFAQEATYTGRMKVGQALSEKLKPKLGAKERAVQFANAMDDAGKLVKKETGQYQPIEEILKPKQMNIIYKIKNELGRDVRLKEQATAGMKRMNEIMGTMHDIPKVTILERAIVIMNAVLKRIEGRNQAATLKMIAEKMKDPKEMARIIKSAKPAEAKLLRSLDPEMVASMIATLEEEK